MVQHCLVDKGLSLWRLHGYTQTPFSLGNLWTSDQPDSTQHSKETDIYALGGIWKSNPNKQATAEPHLKQRGHWEKQLNVYIH